MGVRVVTPGARIQAAIEILADLAQTRQPADKAVKDWGAAHRFAGAKDRAAIRSLVFATYRRRGAAAALMGAETPRALIIGSLRLGMGLKAAEIDAAMTGRAHDAAPLTPEERKALEGPQPKLSGALNWPSWLAEKLRATYGDQAEALMAALIETAPLDIRVNTLKANRDHVIPALQSVGFPAEPTPYSPWGIRVMRDDDMIGANIRTLPMFRSGLIDVQDEGSQLVALLSGAAPGMQVLELCAGGGGKTLALAAMMGPTGQIYACDVDPRRLKAGQERVARAGVHNVQPTLVHHWLTGAERPTGDAKEGADPDLEVHAGKMDLVFLDVPCTGSGAWRRQPDAKWQLSPERLAEFVALQAAILERGARLVKPGGRIAYVTCSLLAEENDEQIAAFLSRHPEFGLIDPSPLAGEVSLEATVGRAPSKAQAAPPLGRFAATPPAGGGRVDIAKHAIQLSPITTHTDGFFFALLERTA